MLQATAPSPRRPFRTHHKQKTEPYPRNTVKFLTLQPQKRLAGPFIRLAHLMRGSGLERYCKLLSIPAAATQIHHRHFTKQEQIPPINTASSPVSIASTPGQTPERRLALVHEFLYS